MLLKLKDLRRDDKLLMSCASRGRDPSCPSNRKTGCPTEQRLEPNTTGIANCITSVEKDSYVLEVDLEIRGENNVRS